MNDIRHLHENVFGEPEGQAISRLVYELLNDSTALPLLSLVAVDNKEIIGHIIFSSVQIGSTNNNIPAYILAPLAVARHLQRKGIGKSLIDKGLGILRARGAELIFVLGDPDYYSRSGFETAQPYDLKPPYQLEYPEAWMVLELRPGALKNTQGVVNCASSLSSEEYW
jgi:predicted N-acetyltransferase YhbS